MIYIQSGYTGWIGTLRKGVVFQVSREKKREDRGGEGGGNHRWRDAEGGKAR